MRMQVLQVERGDDVRSDSGRPAGRRALMVATASTWSPPLLRLNKTEVIRSVASLGQTNIMEHAELLHVHEGDGGEKTQIERIDQTTSVLIDMTTEPQWNWNSSINKYPPAEAGGTAREVERQTKQTVQFSAALLWPSMQSSENKVLHQCPRFQEGKFARGRGHE